MIKRFLWVGLLIGVLAGMGVPQVFACSGYPYFGIEDLPTMELLVRATVLDVDDRGYNAVIRVEDYYKGEGARILTVMRYPVALSTGALVRGYDTSCLYSGRGHRWVRGSQGYFGLMSNGDGTYTDENGGTAHFYSVDGMITYQEGATEGYAVEFDEALSINEEDFIELMLETGGREAPIEPVAEGPQFYPLMRFLNITTEDGSRYQMNPDRSITVVPEDAPLAISPDGAHVAFRVDEQTIAFQYIWTEYVYDEEMEERLGDDQLEQFIVQGQSVRFSNDSNFAIVWDQTQLTVVMFNNDSGSIYYGYGNGMRVHQVAQVSFAAAEEDDDLPTVLWSADSSTIAWNDSSGIWHWDLVNSAEPQQLMTREDLTRWQTPSLLDLSTFGRYVRVGQSDEWSLIDADTGSAYDNMLVAPNEQLLITLSGALSAADEWCTPPLRDNCSVQLQQSSLDMVFPYQSNLIGTVSCSSEQGSCTVNWNSWHPAIVGGGYGTTISGLRQISHDPQYDQSAIVVDDYLIYLAFYSDSTVSNEDYQPYLNILDLEDMLDSPIASIEWGQFVFYDEYNLTASTFIAR
jgi:hypothetical protein